MAVESLEVIQWLQAQCGKQSDIPRVDIPVK